MRPADLHEAAGMGRAVIDEPALYDDTATPMDDMRKFARMLRNGHRPLTMDCRSPLQAFAEDVDASIWELIQTPRDWRERVRVALDSVFWLEPSP